MTLFNLTRILVIVEDVFLGIALIYSRMRKFSWRPFKFLRVWRSAKSLWFQRLDGIYFIFLPWINADCLSGALILTQRSATSKCYGSMFCISKISGGS